VCGDCGPRPGASMQEAAHLGQESVKTLAAPNYATLTVRAACPAIHLGATPSRQQEQR
jgi:hypothetical protein